MISVICKQFVFLNESKVTSLWHYRDTSVTSQVLFFSWETKVHKTLFIQLETTKWKVEHGQKSEAETFFGRSFIELFSTLFERIESKTLGPRPFEFVWRPFTFLEKTSSKFWVSWTVQIGRPTFRFRPCSFANDRLAPQWTSSCIWRF